MSFYKTKTSRPRRSIWDNVPMQQEKSTLHLLLNSDKLLKHTGRFWGHLWVTPLSARGIRKTDQSENPANGGGTIHPVLQRNPLPSLHIGTEDNGVREKVARDCYLDKTESTDCQRSTCQTREYSLRQDVNREVAACLAHACHYHIPERRLGRP